MHLIWKVGDTYHLCGEGVETEVHTLIAGESCKLFLPLFDSNKGFAFLAHPRVEPRVPGIPPRPGLDMPKAAASSRKRWLVAKDKEPTGN